MLQINMKVHLKRSMKPFWRLIQDYLIEYDILISKFYLQLDHSSIDEPTIKKISKIYILYVAIIIITLTWFAPFMVNSSVMVSSCVIVRSCVMVSSCVMDSSCMVSSCVMLSSCVMVSSCMVSSCVMVSSCMVSSCVMLVHVLWLVHVWLVHVLC